MANEKDVSNDSNAVTDADLEKSLQNLGVEVSEEDKAKKEKVKEEKLTPEQIEQRERSNLGRKVKRLEDTLSEINERLEMLTSRETTKQSATDEEVPEIISTPSDVDKVIDRREKRKQEDQQKYSQNYIREFKVLRSRDPEMFDEIWTEMTSNFNRRYSERPDLDAMVNYADAKAAVLSKKYAESKPNVRGKKGEVSTDLSIESRQAASELKPIKLDPLAEEFARSTGMSEESIRKALE